MIPDKRSKKELKRESSKLPGQVGEMAGEFNKTMGEVTLLISKGVEAAGTIGESILGGWQSIRRLRGVGAKQEDLLNVSLDQADLDRLDLLVESGFRDSRSKVAAFFISEGVKARQKRLESLAEKMGKTRPEKG